MRKVDQVIESLEKTGSGLSAAIQEMAVGPKDS